MSFKALKVDGTWEDVETGDIGEYVAISTDTYGGSLEDVQNYFLGCGKYTWGNKIYAGYPNLALMQGEDGYNTGWYKFENTSSWKGSWDSTGCTDLDYNMYTLAFKRKTSYDTYTDLDLITNINLKKCMLYVSIQKSTATVDGVDNTDIYRINTGDTRIYVGNYYLVANKSVPYIQLHQTSPITSEWSLDGWFPADLSINLINKQTIGLSCDLRNDTTSYKFGEGNVYYISGEERKLPYKTGYRWGASQISQFTFVPCLSGSKTENLIDSNQTVKYITLDNDVVYRVYYSTSSRTVSLTTDGFKTLDACLLHIAKLGFSFKYDNTYYKPIAENGLITGYTTDLAYESEWDEWTTTDTIKRPGGGGGGEGIDKDDINEFPLDDAAGVCKYYALDTYDLSELNSSIYEDTAGVPLNPSDFIVGLWLLPINLSQFSSGIEPIKLGTHTINASGSRMTTTRKVFDLGTTTLNWHYNGTFLDYAPYTEVSVYVPYCGMVHLPTSLCMNYSSNTINVKLVVDAISGACKGIVSINGTIYTSINGSMLSSIPISAEQCATKAQTTVSACVNAISGIVGIPSYSASASSGNVDVFNKGAMTASLYTTGTSSQQSYNVNPVSAGVTAISSIGNSMITYNNIAPDYIAGSTDSSVNYYMPQYCKLFMSYPKVDMGDIAHTHGKVCNYQDTLSNCSGFTVVKRPHLNITCTNEERDEITALLESGVIL